MQQTLQSGPGLRRLIYTVNYSPWSAYSGGGQRSAHHLASEMASRGHDVHMIASRSPIESFSVPENLPYTLHWAPLYHYKSSRHAPLRPLTAWGVQRITSRLLSESTLPVILHANGEEGARIGKLKKQWSFAFVITPRYPDYPAALARWTDLSLLAKSHLWLTEWKHLMLRNALQQADLICPPSHWAAVTIQNLFGLNSTRIEPVPNGAPTEFLTVERQNEACKGPILFFGRLSRDKGVDLLLEAYGNLDSKRPPLWIAGEGDEKSALQGLADRLGLSQQVRFLPWQTHEQLAYLLGQSCMAVLPSRRENYSLAILSCLAAGTPTISTRVGGTPEQITDGVNGWLVESGDPTGLAQAIEGVIQHPEQAEAIGRKAAARARSEQTWDAACDRFEELYEGLIR